MARLIDANELKQRILEERDKIPRTLSCAVYELRIDKPNHHGNAIRGGIRKALHCMEQCKTVDAVPVVRCKDCYYGVYAGFGKVMCDLHPIVEKAHFYCASGERKDND